MGRRLLAITLLIALGCPAVLPLFAATADPEKSLPACCRRHGAHRCAMLPAETASAPALQAPPCPFYPAVSTTPQSATATLIAPLLDTVAQIHNAAPVVPAPHRAHAILVSSNLKRGPPALLA